MDPDATRYPLLLSLTGRLAAVVCDDPSETLVRALLRLGARVRVVTPVPAAALVALAEEGAITLERRGYVRGDLRGATLAFGDGAVPELGAAMAAEARECGCLLNLSGDASSDFLPMDGTATSGEAR